MKEMIDWLETMPLWLWWVLASIPFALLSYLFDKLMDHWFKI